MSIGEALVRLGAPVGVAVLFSTALVAGLATPDRDLQLIAPQGAVPGRPVALRGLLLEDLDRPEGPRLGTGSADVALLSPEGEVRARGVLEPSAAAGLEGALPVPDGLAGTYRLRATLRLADGGEAGPGERVHGPLEVGPGAPPVPLRGRLASPLQQYQPFPPRPVGDAAVPRPLGARVVGGACVPERPCRVLLRRGEAAIRIRIEPSAALEVVEPAAGGEAGPAIDAATVVVHGPEADLRLVAMRDGTPVARRTVRLPIAQGAPVLELASPIGRAPHRPELTLRGSAPSSAVLVDGFRDGYWERAASGRVGPEGRVEWPGAPLGAGVWRIQVRRDPLSTETAATRVIVVLAEGAPAPAAVRHMAARSLARELDDPLARRVRARGPLPGVPAPLQVAYLAALQELRLAPQPVARSGSVQQATGAQSTGAQWRHLAAAGVVLIGLAVGLYLWWRGRRAAREARRILAQEGEGPVAPDGAVREGVLVALFVVLVFGVIALFMVGRTGG